MLVFALLALVPFASAAQIFQTCLVPGTVAPAPTFGAAAPGPSFDDPGACADFCAGQANALYSDGRITYSYHSQNPRMCQCSQSGPAANTAKECRNPDDIVVFRLRTTFNYDACYSFTNNAVTLVTNVLNECYTMCRRESQVIYSINTATNRYSCSCPPAGTQFTTPISCAPSPNIVWRHVHPYPAASAGLVRRRRVQSRGAEDYCPGSLTACKIPGSTGYECVDTSSELESCGGCMHGLYSASGKTGVQGVNCAALDGSLYSTMTCKAGECVDEY